MHRTWFLHHVCTKYFQKWYHYRGFQIPMGRIATAIGAQNLFTFYRNLNCVSNSALISPPFFVFHSHQFPGKRIDAGVENPPRSLRNAIYFWSKSALLFMANNLLAECTALMVSNFSTTHSKMIGPITMRTAPFSTDAYAFDYCYPSSSSFI